MDYLGKSQRYGKNRTQEHIGDVVKFANYIRKKKYNNNIDDNNNNTTTNPSPFDDRLITQCCNIKNNKNNINNNDVKHLTLDSFVKYFAQHCVHCKNKNEVQAMMKEILSFKILWKGDQIKCMKSHKKLTCVLCMKEHLEILKQLNNDKSKLINDKHELFGPCQCNTRFHWFVRTTTSTDDGVNLEKKDGDESLNSDSDACNFMLSTIIGNKQTKNLQMIWMN